MSDLTAVEFRDWLKEMSVDKFMDILNNLYRTERFRVTDHELTPHYLLARLFFEDLLERGAECEEDV